MADQQPEVGAAPTSDTPAPAIDRAARVDASRAQTRADVLAELEKQAPPAATEAKPADKKVESKPADKATEKKPDKPAAAADDLDDDLEAAAPELGDDLDEADLDDEDAELEAAAKLDPDTAKRHALLKKQEARAKETLQRDRAAFVAEIEQWKPRIAKVERLEKLTKDVRFKPAEVLIELGLQESDFEAAAQDLYARSTEGAKDPKRRDHVARLQRERERDAKLEAYEKKIDELSTKVESREQAAQDVAQLDSYFGTIEKHAGAHAPLLAKQLEANPKRARADLTRIAWELAQVTGSMPKKKVVMATYEKNRRAELEELGIDTKQFTPKPKTPDSRKEPAGDNAQTQRLDTQVPRSAPKSARELRDEVVGALESGSLE